MGQDVEDFEGHFSNYAEYSKTLRSWLVAYGIGGPVLFLISKDAPEKLSKSPHIELIVSLFVAGVASQILLAFLNKWAAWHMYSGGYDRHLTLVGDNSCGRHHESRTYRVWHWINKQSWIDFVVDLGALSSFSVATWLVLSILLTSSQTG